MGGCGGDFTRLTRKHGVKVGAGSPCSVEEVALAVGDVIGHGSVKSAARIGKITISNIPPFISDEFLVRELSRHGKVVSGVQKLSSGYKSPLLRHVVSHRRQLYMILNNRKEEFNCRFQVKIDNFEYMIFATSSFMQCLGCGGGGSCTQDMSQTGRSSSAAGRRAGRGRDRWGSNAGSTAGGRWARRGQDRWGAAAGVPPPAAAAGGPVEEETGAAEVPDTDSASAGRNNSSRQKQVIETVCDVTESAGVGDSMETVNKIICLTRHLIPTSCTCIDKRNRRVQSCAFVLRSLALLPLLHEHVPDDSHEIKDMSPSVYFSEQLT
ncbi:hypothetical protein F2P81_009688 [Scophthalmus maximus]|uniref:Uncharacterized protein n=1 Tax=Scophthalmus maximus TaxID=52904 RepID=A0A6A4T7M1_SCOMX|nr:hypothetical protein F2P81_009688 [Scophthalmus maximus]